MRIIAFAGRKQSGKSELASVCIENFENVSVFSFGNALKNLCAELLNITYDELNEIKNIPNKFSIAPDIRWIRIINKRTNIDEKSIRETINGTTFTSVRMMLQIIGTNLIRKFEPNWHVDTLINEIKEYQSTDKIIIVDDCRFPNEKKALEELGADVYFILRPTNMNVSNHDSETGLKWYDFDYDKIIINDMEINKLREYWRIEMVKVLGLSPCLDTIKNPIMGDSRIFMGFNYAFTMEKCKTAMAAGILLEYGAIDKTNGFNHYHSNNEHLYDIIYTTLYGMTRTKEEMPDIEFYNPYIVENLKMFMD